MMELLRRMAGEGRTILFSSHILEEVERLAESVLVIVAGRLAASGDFREIRRLMTDRPHTFTIRSSDDRRLAAGLVAHGSVYGVELTRRPARRPDRGLRRLHPGPGRDRPRPACRCSRSARPTRTSRACSATWCGDDRGHRRADPAGPGRPAPGDRGEPARGAADPARGDGPAGRPHDRSRHDHRDGDGPARGLDARPAHRPGLRDLGAGFGARRRDRGLSPGQADRAMADRRGQGPRRSRAGDPRDGPGGVRLGDHPRGLGSGSRRPSGSRSEPPSPRPSTSSCSWR